jgi:rhodanese-related sulfurtransferase
VGRAKVTVAPRRQTRYVWSPEGNVPAIEIDPSEVKRRLDAGEKIRMVDVREPFEHQQAHIAGAELIPMRSVPQSLEPLRAGDGQLVLFCHHGMRSLQVTEWLRRQGLEDSVSMAGGIDRWSLEIDPAVPRYH